MSRLGPSKTSRRPVPCETMSRLRPSEPLRRPEPSEITVRRSECRPCDSIVISHMFNMGYIRRLPQFYLAFLKSRYSFTLLWLSWPIVAYLLTDSVWVALVIVSAFFVIASIYVLGLLYVTLVYVCSDLRDLQKYYLKDDSAFFVAEVPGEAQPIGTAAILPEEDIGGLQEYAIRPKKNKNTDRKVAELKRMVVSPDYVQKGVGRKLVERCIEFAKEHGYDVIQLNTSGYQRSAPRFYESCGFKPTGAYLERVSIYCIRMYLYELDLHETTQS